MRAKNLIFQCECGKAVFRLTKGCRYDESSSVGACAKCSGAYTPESGKSISVSPTAAVPLLYQAPQPNPTDVKASLEYYQTKLNKTRKLAVLHPEYTFYQLWKLTE